MNTIIYLIRHAAVENPNKINYGRLRGYGLSKEGRVQAIKIRDFFIEKDVSKIYSSPLLRTRQTAEIIAEKRIPLKFSKKLIEVNFGKLEGKPLEQTLKVRNNKVPQKGYPKESYQKVQQRMVKEIFKIVKKHRGQNILIISHADPIVTARLFFEGKPLTEINKAMTVNGSATILTFNDELQCKKIEYKNITGAKRDF